MLGSKIFTESANPTSGLPLSLVEGSWHVIMVSTDRGSKSQDCALEDHCLLLYFPKANHRAQPRLKVTLKQHGDREGKVWRIEVIVWIHYHNSQWQNQHQTMSVQNPSKECSPKSLAHFDQFRHSLLSPVTQSVGESNWGSHTNKASALVRSLISNSQFYQYLEESNKDFRVINQRDTNF